MTGIASHVLLRPGFTNYIAQAWTACVFAEERLGHRLDRREVSLAVNAPPRRFKG
ncbi:hypothetical protein EBB05_22590 [Methylobacterium brachiatum]|nr:hypothetical protein EBB05_22590 [Methylobacterium brachiatum]